jgi:hypothetical protein
LDGAGRSCTAHAAVGGRRAAPTARCGLFRFPVRNITPDDIMQTARLEALEGEA